MSAYSNWSRAYAREVCRRELMDPTGRWWGDEELNGWIEDWQAEVQQRFEFVWGTATLTTTQGTISLSSLPVQFLRLDAVYYSSTQGDRGFRLAGRNLEDLEVAHVEWRSADADTPRQVVQYDSTQLILWPPPSAPAILTFEAPRLLTFSGDVDVVRLPIWTQWSLIPYVASAAFTRPGPTNDLAQARKYRARYAGEIQRIQRVWAQWIPERYRQLKPMGPYDRDILFPPVPWGGDGGALAQYTVHTPTGDVDGENAVFLLPFLGDEAKVFVNGILQSAEVDYTLIGPTIIFTTPPVVGSTLLVWIFIAGL
jgi:hypothetical protein